MSVINGFTENDGKVYFKIGELKHLQSEINDCKEWIAQQQPDSEWSLLWEHNYNTIDSNQDKIKKIIEEI